ncbi:unnamed protein product, partial [Prorocentrum cordatum]
AAQGSQRIPHGVLPVSSRGRSVAERPRLAPAAMPCPRPPARGHCRSGPGAWAFAVARQRGPGRQRRRHGCARPALLLLVAAAAWDAGAGSALAQGPAGGEGQWLAAPPRPRRCAARASRSSPEHEPEPAPDAREVRAAGVGAQRAARPPLGTLWEQWGLLGLVVGVAVALTTATPEALEGLDNGMEELGWLEGGLGLGGTVALLEFQLQQGLQDVAKSVPAEVRLALEQLVGAGEPAPEAASAGEAVAAGLRASGAAAEIAGAASTGAEALSSAAAVLEAGALGAVTGGYAGLLAGAMAEPVRPKDDARFLEPSNRFTPGTIRPRGAGGSPVEDDERPMSAASLGWANFLREWKQLLRAAGGDEARLRRHVPSFVANLVLSNEAVLERERARPEVPTPVPVRVAYDVLCWFIDVVFEDRPIQRFWFLETVARMPYFAYSSVLHLYETLGWWRSPELRAVHSAEEDNELHHLLIMESLGGDQRWLDRFFAQHGAIAYYWILILFFVVDPRWSYNFSRLIEAHAVDTYGEFVDANSELLKRLPPPPIAVEYYLSGELYLFDKFQTAKRASGQIRRPPCATLHDVFSNIRKNEQHVLTMEACEAWVAGGEPPVPVGFNQISEEEYREAVVRDPAGRAAWEAWGKELNAAVRARERKKSDA